MQASAQITPQGGQQYRLQLNGQFSPLWAGNLATGLAAQGVSIVSGRGRGTGLEWTAELQLDFSQSAALPESLDYVQLAHSHGGAIFAHTVQLSRFTCSRLPTGMLEVWVFGPDQPGLLARLLGRMGAMGLFPVQFDIHTAGDRIENRFVLSSLGGITASQELQEACEKTLRSFCTAEAVS